MAQFLNDIYICMQSVIAFIGRISNSFWVYPILLYVFISVFFFLITDNR